EDSPFEGVNYYRLAQQDFDKQTTHSPIISVFYKNKKDLKPLVFFDGKKINITFPFRSRGQFILFNQLGQVILNTNIQNGKNEISFPLLSPDIYFFQIKTKHEMEVGKIFLK
ncbi:MAG TPA: T9SS type A sorting domain-containing protein, partial [Phaeodactylibacter sp.]|nr:T9SS type A sorting domain-containing protein [Phaeodactylibacter sp.]